MTGMLGFPCGNKAEILTDQFGEGDRGGKVEKLALAFFILQYST
jgi:hypothetical protein